MQVLADHYGKGIVESGRLLDPLLHRRLIIAPIGAQEIEKKGDEDAENQYGRRQAADIPPEFSLRDHAV